MGSAQEDDELLISCFSIVSLYCVKVVERASPSLSVFFNEGTSLKTSFSGSGKNLETCGNDDKLSNYKITVVGMTTISLQKYTRQNVTLCNYSMRDFSWSFQTFNK